MKMSKLTGGLLVSLLLSASVAIAKNDYPAADFQPKVVYQDSEYKHSGSSSSSSKSSSGEVSVADSNYPAANFEPKVLFEDTGYKHTKGATGTISKSVSAQNVNVEQSSEAATDGDSEESSMSLILGLIAVAVAGLVFNRNQFFSNIKKQKKAAPRRKAKVQQAVAASNNSNGDSSGVARYLETKVSPAPSGVAKYLEERVGTSTSGVAKYVAKQKISARLASVTGVEKYLKDRG